MAIIQSVHVVAKSFEGIDDAIRSGLLEVSNQLPGTEVLGAHVNKVSVVIQPSSELPGGSLYEFHVDLTVEYAEMVSEEFEGE